MYTLNEQPAEFSELNTKCKELVAEILGVITPTQTAIKLIAGSVLYSTVNDNDKLYVLRDGSLSYSRQERQIFYFEPGDLIGLENHFCSGGVKIAADFAVVVDEYNYEDLRKALASTSHLQSIWTQYFAFQLHLFSLMISQLTKEDDQVAPDFRHFKPGEIIIEQGAESHEVFNLIEGHAEVFVDGVLVGEVLADEIFGAMASLSDTKRTATVKADSNCLVLALPKDNFIQLIESRPYTVLKMVHDMARTIVALNEQVVKLGRQRG